MLTKKGLYDVIAQSINFDSNKQNLKLEILHVIKTTNLTIPLLARKNQDMINIKVNQKRKQFYSQFYINRKFLVIDCISKTLQKEKVIHKRIGNDKAVKLHLAAIVNSDYRGLT